MPDIVYRDDQGSISIAGGKAIAIETVVGGVMYLYRQGESLVIGESLPEPAPEAPETSIEAHEHLEGEDTE